MIEFVPFGKLIMVCHPVVNIPELNYWYLLKVYAFQSYNITLRNYFYLCTVHPAIKELLEESITPIESPLKISTGNYKPHAVGFDHKPSASSSLKSISIPFSPNRSF